MSRTLTRALISDRARLLTSRGRRPQTLLIAWRQLPGLCDPQRLEAWLFTLPVNACRAEIRHVGRWQRGLQLVADDSQPVDDIQSDEAQFRIALFDGNDKVLLDAPVLASAEPADGVSST